MPKYISGLSSNGTALLKEDDYPFKVISAKMRTSKKGSEMIELTHEVGDNGNTVRIFDFLVFDGGLFTSGRIDQFRTAIGEVILPGEEVDFAPGDALHKEGRMHVVIEEWNGKKSNKVGSYLEPQDDIPGLEPPKPKPAKKLQPF